MALLSDKTSGAATIEYSFFVLVVGGVLLLIGFRGGVTVLQSPLLAGAIGALVGLVYRQQFEPELYPMKKELMLAVVPLLISPLFAGLIGFYYYFRGD